MFHAYEYKLASLDIMVGFLEWWMPLCKCLNDRTCLIDAMIVTCCLDWCYCHLLFATLGYIKHGMLDEW